MSDEELCSRLRYRAEVRQARNDDVYGLLNEAADTIERLLNTCEGKQATISRLSKKPVRRYTTGG